MLEIISTKGTVFNLYSILDKGGQGVVYEAERIGVLDSRKRVLLMQKKMVVIKFVQI